MALHAIARKSVGRFLYYSWTAYKW